MYRFSRQIFLELKDSIDPGTERLSRSEARRRVLRACEATVERMAADPRYFPRPARSLFEEIHFYFPIHERARVYHAIERTLNVARDFIQEESDRNAEANSACRATTRRGTSCLRTPLPGREFCPSHAHLEDIVLAG